MCWTLEGHMLRLLGQYTREDDPCLPDSNFKINLHVFTYTIWIHMCMNWFKM